jgi:hypothetical protein
MSALTYTRPADSVRFSWRFRNSTSFPNLSHALSRLCYLPFVLTIKTHYFDFSAIFQYADCVAVTQHRIGAGNYILTLRAIGPHGAFISPPILPRRAPVASKNPALPGVALILSSVPEAKANQPIGECRLCLKQKPLHKSHLMPHALYAHGKRKITFATRTKSGFNPKEIKDHLLCFDCEQRFDGLGEKEVLRWLAPKSTKDFPLHDRLRVACPCETSPPNYPPLSVFRCSDVGIDAAKFTYFTLSVMWRRAIHDWVGFDGEGLPAGNLGAFGEQLRAFLAGEAPFPPDTAVLVKVCSDSYSREFWTAPSTDVVHNCLGLEFLARGVYFRALMGKHLPPDSHTLSCSLPYERVLYGHCREETMEKLRILAPL